MRGCRRVRTTAKAGVAALGLGLLALLLPTLAAVKTASAADLAATPSISAWTEDLAALECHPDAGRYDLEDLLLFGLSWGDLGAEQLQRWTEAGITDHLARGGSIAQLEKAADWTEFFLAQMGAAQKKFRADAARLGRSLCPMLDAIAGDDIARFALADREKPGRYRTHFRLAQQILLYHSCLPVDGGSAADGAFGPVSRTAWNAAVRAARARNLILRRASKPTPGQVVDLAALATHGGLCDARPAAPMLDSRALLAVAADCAAGQDFGAATLTLLRDRFRQVALGGSQALRHDLIVAGTFCADPDRWAAPDAALSALLIRDLPPADGLYAASERAGALAAGLTGGAAATTEIRPGTIASLSRAAAVALHDPTIGGRPDTAVAVMALILGPPGPSDPHDVPELLHLIGAGLDGLPLDPALRADTQRRYRALGLDRHAGGSALIRTARFIAARDHGTDPQGISTLLIEQAEAGGFFESSGDIAVEQAPEALLHTDVSLTTEGMVAMTQLATLAEMFPEVLSLLHREADAKVAFAVGELLFEGYAKAPRSDRTIAAGIALIGQAADAGLGIALLRRAQLRMQGILMPRDPGGALDDYTKAAVAGQPDAAVALAEAYELGSFAAQDWTLAERYWRMVLAPETDPPTPAAFARAREAVAEERPFFLTGPGKSLADEAQSRLSTWAGSSPDRRQQAQKAASAIGRQYLSRQTASAPDPVAAALWLRLAVKLADIPGQDQSDRLRLAHILLVRPDLAIPGETPAQLLYGTPEGFWLGSRSPELLAAEILRGCAFDTSACIAFQHRAATGGIADTLIAPASLWLERAAVDEAAARVVAPPGTPLPAAASIAFLDALAFRGDWEGAARIAATLPPSSLSPSGGTRAFALRNGAFRRALQPSSLATGAALPKTLASLLRALAELGDPDARAFLLATGPRPARGAVALDQARAAYATAEPLGPGSPALSRTAARLAPLEAAAGNPGRALELTLVALGSDLASAGLDALTDGPLPAALTRLCALESAARGLDDLGHADLALPLARQAVNDLLDIRRSVSGLSGSMPDCLGGSLPGAYRWLADLLIRQGLAAEADVVLTRLQAAETLGFVGGDAAFQALPLSPLPVPDGDRTMVKALSSVTPVGGPGGIRLRQLLRQKSVQPLTASETGELADLQAAAPILPDSQRLRLQALIREAGSITAPPPSGLSIARYLTPADARTSAALQYVVLPDRIGLVVTLRGMRRSLVLDRIGGQPLTPALLGRAVENFRKALRDPASDPRTASRLLSDLLLPPEVLAVLDAQGIDRLILSPDGPLRGIPFAALRVADLWLVQRFDLILSTESRTPPPDAPLLRIAAFGASGIPGEPTVLPDIRRDLEVLVRKDQADSGLLDGTIVLNRDFTRRSLSAGLRFGAPFSPEPGIVHVAAPVHFGLTEAGSSLVLGDGTRMGFDDMREAIGIDMHFTEVGLLTFPASDSGSAQGASEGPGPEGFAAVLQRAGTGAVLATLWPVADGSSEALIAGMYERQVAGIPLDKALSDSQRAVLAGAQVDDGKVQPAALGSRASLEAGALFPGHSHPYFWASAVLLEGAP